MMNVSHIFTLLLAKYMFLYGRLMLPYVHQLVANFAESNCLLLLNLCNESVESEPKQLRAVKTETMSVAVKLRLNLNLS